MAEIKRWVPRILSGTGGSGREMDMEPGTVDAMRNTEVARAFESLPVPRPEDLRIGQHVWLRGGGTGPLLEISVLFGRPLVTVDVDYEVPVRVTIDSIRTLEEIQHGK